MTTPKQLFNANKDLRTKAVEVLPSSWFRELLIYAKASLLARPCTADQLNGINAFEEELLTMCDVDPPEAPTLTTGLLPEPNLSRNIKEPKKE